MATKEFNGTDAVEDFIEKWDFISGTLESMSAIVWESREDYKCDLASVSHVLTHAHKEAEEARKLFDQITAKNKGKE